jgi:copper chaperone NosL
MTSVRPGVRAGMYAVIAAVWLSACAPAGPQPPEIAYGQDVCDECGMIVSEAKYAAATLVEKGGPHKFDSIADMLAYHMERPNEQVRAWFVHDYGTGNWIRAETAFYVVNDKIHSPMPPGIAAFESQDAAKAFAVEVGSGNIMVFDDVRAAVHLALHG